MDGLVAAAVFQYDLDSGWTWIVRNPGPGYLRKMGKREGQESPYDPRFHVAPSEDAQREQERNDEADDRGDKKQE